MPITPLHLGFGVLAHSASPKKVSFLGFAAANFVVDLEPAYKLFMGQEPLHGFSHTMPGALLATLATVILAHFALLLAARLRLPNMFQWRSLTLRAVAIGAALGTASHLLADAVMHADMQPFAPFSPANPLLFAISVDTLHYSCWGSAALGLAVLAARRIKTVHTR